ncbi:YbaK/EbsC family protein [Streptococcus dentiloxodontae]
MEGSEKELYRLLNAKGIDFELVRHKPIWHVLDADFELKGQALKSLLLKNRSASRFYLVVAPAEIKLDLKQLAKDLDDTRLSFASEEELAELLKVKPGAVTPFACLFHNPKKLRLYLDSRIVQSGLVGCPPFRNDKTLWIRAEDFRYLLSRV